MPLFDITQVSLERAISGATMRQTVLASNMANANTPGYLPQDVDFHGALRSALKSGQDMDSVKMLPQPRGTGATRADGNGVDPDAEAAKISETGLELSALARVAGARIDILKSAIGTR
jgi:flagellar basal-body rod protein FlgB